MAISDDDIRLVRQTLPLVRARLHAAASDFYENLFALAPEMRALFREDLSAQGMRFLSTLDMIVDLLDDRSAFDRACTDLARLHATVGVRPEHFGPMGSALRVTLGETLGPEFSLRVQEAWEAAYAHIAAEMAARMRLARGEP